MCSSIQIFSDIKISRVCGSWYSLRPAQHRPLRIIFVIKATFGNGLLISIPELKTLVIACNHRPRVILVDALCNFAASEVLSQFLSLMLSQHAAVLDVPSIYSFKNVYNFKAFIH